MKIKSNSWHWWMVKTFTNCEDRHDLRRVANACAYRRKVIKAVIAMLLTGLLLSALLFFGTSPAWVPILYWVTGTFEHGGTDFGVLAIMITCLYAVIGVVSFFATNQHKKFGKWIAKHFVANTPASWWVEKPKVVKPPREPGFIEQWIKDAYSKICPTELELVDPDDE